MHRLRVARVLLPGLLGEALGLVLGVVQLGEAVGDLAPGDVELEALGDLRLPVARARKRRDLGGVVHDEGGLDQLVLDGVLEQRELQAADAVSLAMGDIALLELCDERVAVIQRGLGYGRVMLAYRLPDRESL